MHRFKRQTCNYSIIGLMLVGLSACSSENTNDIENEGDDQPSPSANPSDLPDQSTELTPADDGNQAPDESPEDTQVPVGPSSDTSSIAGFWNLTQTTSEGVDVVHVQIEPNGQLTEFDYLGDNTGDGRDCYIIRKQQIVARGADQYDIQNDSVLPGSDGSEDVMILVEDGSIVFRYFALISAPEGGNELSPQTAQFPASDLMIDNLSACE